MTQEDREYCAARALACGEPLLGTAPQVDAWLLIEYQPLWEKKALENNGLPGFVNAWINNELAALERAGYKPRAQFIRRRRDRDHRLNVFTARDGELRHAFYESYEDMTETDFGSLAADVVTEPNYFVCSNGRRDVCCSRFGLPVYAALRERVGDRAWETTHVGGHRYAANVLTLPQGALYGYLSPEAVEEFVGCIDRGALATSFLRGRSAYPPAAQAAETLLENGEGELETIDGDIVTFRTAAGLVHVRATRAAEALQVLPSCGKDMEAFHPWQVERITP